MLVKKTSILDGKEYEMDLPVTQERIDAWRSSRTLIQNAFPELSAEQREFLLSGIVPAEWDKTFNVCGSCKNWDFDGADGDDLGKGRCDNVVSQYCDTLVSSGHTCPQFEAE